MAVLVLLLARFFLVDFVCSRIDPCPLDVHELPAFLGAERGSANLVLAVFVLFLLPFGYASVLATIIGLDLGLRAGFSWEFLFALYLLASAVSVVSTYGAVRILMQKFSGSGAFALWRRRIDAASFVARKLVGRVGILAGLAVGNAVSSLVYVSALAVVLRVDAFEALVALFAGNLLSFGFAALVVVGVRLATQDFFVSMLIAFLVVLAAHHLLVKRVPQARL